MDRIMGDDGDDVVDQTHGQLEEQSSPGSRTSSSGSVTPMRAAQS
ncbi:hypothetical protein QFZ63_005029 [Streptomyces sp. B3I7]|nr:hypothetical protein [Streptomyces sp. B3I7]